MNSLRIPNAVKIAAAATRLFFDPLVWMARWMSSLGTTGNGRALASDEIASLNAAVAAISSESATDRPVVFQKYFKSGKRTYASQIKIARNGNKYLVLTEGSRDEETQEVKKRVLCVSDQDLKDFFAMLQETVVYLRNTKDEPRPVAGAKYTLRKGKVRFRRRKSRERGQDKSSSQ